MNNIIERKWKRNSMVNIEDLRGMAFQGEKKAHIFKITGYDVNGNKINLDGTPSGVVLRPDHTDVVLECEIQDGIVRALLPKACYDVQGRIGISIFLTDGGQTTCIYAAVASVNRTSSGNEAPPATTNVVDLVNAISAAVATIPQSWSGLMADIAPTYSSSAVYAVGAYAYYNGDLYRCTTAINSGETWNSAHWQAAAIGTDLLAVKNQIPVIDDNAGAGDTAKIWSADKAAGENSERMAGIAPTYSSSATYAVGAYVHHNGHLYRCTTAINSGETWNSAHWTLAVLGTDVELINEIINTEIGSDTLPQITFTDGYNIGSNASNKGQIIEASAYSVSNIIDLTNAKTVLCYYTGSNVYGNYFFYDENNNYISNYTIPSSGNKATKDVPANAKYFRFSGQTTKKNSIVLQIYYRGNIYTEISTKLNKNQSAENKGKLLRVGNDGNVYPDRFIPVSDAVIVQSGWAGATSKPQSYYANCKGIDIAQGETITPKSGYECALMNAGGATTVSWFANEYELPASITNYGIIIRKTSASAEIVLQRDGYKLTDYIEEDYASSNAEYNAVEILEPTKGMLFQGSDLNTKSKWNGKKAAFVGDSITAGAQAGSGPLYYQVINSGIGFASVTVDAIAGSGFSGISTDKTPIVQRVSSLPDDLELIIVFAGTNDFGHGVPIGTPGDTTDISFCGAVTSTIKQILAANPSVRLAMMTPLHRASGTYAGEDDVNSQGKVLIDYVNALKEICRKYSIPIIDTYEISGMNPNISEIGTEYFADGLHPNGNGQQELGNRVLPFINLL